MTQALVMTCKSNPTWLVLKGKNEALLHVQTDKLVYNNRQQNRLIMCYFLLEYEYNFFITIFP